MTELKPELKAQIEKEANEKYPFRWPKNKQGEDIIQRPGQNPVGWRKHQNVVNAYIAGATEYALKWQQAEEMMDRMAVALTTINKITGIYEKYSDEQLRDRIDTIRELLKDVIKVSDNPIADYQIYKQTKDGTVNG